MKVKLKALKKPIPSLQWLSKDKVYYVIGIEADNFRILGDDGKPYLYPHKAFEVTDPTEPSDWITKYGEDGERYSYSKEIHRSGFFEAYFDRDPKAKTIFDEYIKRLGIQFDATDQMNGF